jgi:hypothetical protein
MNQSNNETFIAGTGSEPMFYICGFITNKKLLDFRRSDDHRATRRAMPEEVPVHSLHYISHPVRVANKQLLP